MEPTPSRDLTGSGEKGAPSLKTVFITQARSGSTRLPGKVLKVVEGKTLLEWFMERARRTSCDCLCVATTTNGADDGLAALASSFDGVHVTRGSEEDVLARYVQAARETEADVVVRVTSDCPFFDWRLVDLCLFALGENDSEAVRTAFGAYPLGLDVEVYSREALERAGREAREPQEREHVGPYFFRSHPERFRLVWLRPGEKDPLWPDCRLTLDYAEDFELVRRLYTSVGPLAEAEAYRRFLLGHPEAAALNLHLSH